MTQAELAAYIQEHLRSKGIEMVLTGGAVVALYSAGKYVSADIDLVDKGFASFGALKAAMEELGFTRPGRAFEHPETPYFVDFVAAPLSVGDEPVKDINSLEFPTGLLRLISPTDCVKDRLASYFYFNDRQGLEQALLVAAAQEVDLAEVKRWSRAEGMEEKYRDFEKGLEG